MAQYIVWVLVAMVVFGGGHHVVSTAVEGRVGPVGAGGGRWGPVKYRPAYC